MVGDKFYQMCTKEKLSIISYNNPKELLNHRSEVNVERIVCLLDRSFFSCVILINKTYIRANFIWLCRFFNH